ncbi:O-antigen ligase family protein [Psychroflexus sediminis]|uniref:O-antigen ligase like membrane protein n=1 Tax=Psychroflexus sediminis TaxID=470826 RepID=A0A1G7ULC5_9FLAO|nr:O-antigen ligase family protein [Psychroflexus sediminis]SDG47530.1 O-antigen ligase like membrane protein [Psychroflexus sediminis]
MGLNRSIKIKNKFSLNSYIEFTSVLMIFLQGFVIFGVFIIDLRLFYIFLIVNSVLLYSIYGIRLHKYLFGLIFFLIVHAIVVNTYYGIPWSYFIKQTIGISIVAIYFYNVFVLCDMKKMFKLYLKLAIVFCVIAIIFYPTGLLDKEFSRMDGLMTEPSKFIIINVPALYYFLNKKKFIQSFILLLGFILAQSSIGFIAIFIMLLFLFIRKSTLKYVGLTILPFFFLIPYLQTNENFQLRYNQTIENLNVFETKSFDENTNLSSFILLKSAYISINNFIDHPLGTGIGSFAYQHDVYIKDLKVSRYFEASGLKNLNREDANSMFFRILSDFGLFGLLAIIVFLFLGILVFVKDFDSEKKTVCTGILIYFLLKLLRMGHYFPEEMFFFLFMFLFNLPKITLKLNENEPAKLIK